MNGTCQGRPYMRDIHMAGNVHTRTAPYNPSRAAKSDRLCTALPAHSRGSIYIENAKYAHSPADPKNTKCVSHRARRILNILSSSSPGPFRRPRPHSLSPFAQRPYIALPCRSGQSRLNPPASKSGQRHASCTTTSQQTRGTFSNQTNATQQQQQPNANGWMDEWQCQGGNIYCCAVQPRV
jgi:hypothetical protein